MAEIKWTPQAAGDLDAITRFIARDSPHYARLFVVDIFEAAARIARFPSSGRIVPELDNPAIRELILGNYRLVYRLKENLAELLTIYHAARLMGSSKLKM